MATTEFKVFAPVSKCWEEAPVVEKGVTKENAKGHRFFEVAVSGLKEDRDEELMAQQAIDDMVLQFKSGRIAFFPDHGRDERTGERTYSWKQMMGVWIDARQEGDKLMAVCRLNKSHPDADMFWNFIQEGMPLGFSIGGKPVEVVEE